MSKICMATLNDNENSFNASMLQERFPEIPEAVIVKILSQHAHNMEKCITMLTLESEKYLYGGNNSSPDTSPLSSNMKPLSIEIPQHYQPTNNYSTPPYRPSSSSPWQQHATVGEPTTGNVTTATRHDRHPSVDDYNRQLLNHQQQRVERLLNEIHIDEKRLVELRTFVANRNDELVNKKFRVAGNPSKSDVNHLEEETQVLREEIEQMTHEIDRLKSLPMPLKKSESFPQPSSTPCWGNQPPVSAGPHGPQPPWITTQRSHSPDRDRSLEGAGWILVPPSPPPQPPNTPHHDTEQTWECKHCTLVNHGALNHCEICERPRS